jgi:hypothetical protein
LTADRRATDRTRFPARIETPAPRPRARRGPGSHAPRHVGRSTTTTDRGRERIESSPPGSGFLPPARTPRARRPSSPAAVFSRATISSRFFAPVCGVDETRHGSAHCLLTPYCISASDGPSSSQRQLSARGDCCGCHSTVTGPHWRQRSQSSRRTLDSYARRGRVLLCCAHGAMRHRPGSRTSVTLGLLPRANSAARSAAASTGAVLSV